MRVEEEEGVREETSPDQKEDQTEWGQEPSAGGLV